MSDKTQVAVTAGLCLLGALWLLTLPLPWIAAFLCSVALHELFHILAVKLCGGKIYRIRLKAFGAEIETSPLNWWQEMICTMAGPLSGFALLLFARNFPRIALCGLLHSLYNLLPLFPMDGGRMIRSLLMGLVPRHAPKICRILDNVTKSSLVCLALWAAVVVKMGLLPLALLALCLLKAAKAKKSCKDAVLIVQ